jgi:hypothetical protein
MYSGPARGHASPQPMRGADDDQGARAVDEDVDCRLGEGLGSTSPFGGQVVEHAAIMAAGSDLPAVIAWISSHAEAPETPRSKSSTGWAARLTLHCTHRAPSGSATLRASRRHGLAASFRARPPVVIAPTIAPIRGQAMPAKNTVHVSVHPPTRSQTSADRRAAQSAALANQQAMLKQEAADRRQARREDPAAAPGRSHRRRHTAH